MYDFTIQKQMLDVTLDLLKENNLLEVSTLGGGTALAAYYFNHRYSTDIDIFIYVKKNKNFEQYKRYFKTTEKDGVIKFTNLRKDFEWVDLLKQFQMQ